MVPKRRFKRAHDRNRIRRLLKEAYRKQKHLLNPEGLNTVKAFQAAWVYVGTECSDYHVLFEKVGRVLQKLRDLHEDHRTEAGSGEKA